MKRVDDERPDRLMEWFNKALMAADFDLRLQDKEKGKSWKKAPPLFLFNKMMGHVNKMMDPNSGVGQVHAIKVVNYALMIATRITDTEVVFHDHNTHPVTRETLEDKSPSLSNTELADIKLAEEEYAKGEAPVFDSVEELIKTVAYSTSQVDTAGDLLKADLRGLYEPTGEPPEAESEDEE